MITLERVGVKYGPKQVIRDASCCFRGGEITCIIGENGSGKSTLLKAMVQMLPYTGEILYDQTSLRTMARKERARHIAYLPQVRPIPAMDVETLITHGRFPRSSFAGALTAQDKEQIEEAAELTGITHLMKRSISALSGGERQRAYIAMALAQQTEMLLLDEPATYMDIRHQIEVMELLVRLNESGRTVIFTSHDLPQAFSYAQRIVALDQGIIAMDGTPEQIAEKEQLHAIFGVALSRETETGAKYAFKLAK